MLSEDAGITVVLLPNIFYLRSRSRFNSITNSILLKLEQPVPIALPIVPVPDVSDFTFGPCYILYCCIRVIRHLIFSLEESKFSIKNFSFLECNRHNLYGWGTLEI